MTPRSLRGEYEEAGTLEAVNKLFLPSSQLLVSQYEELFAYCCFINFRLDFSSYSHFAI